MTARDRPLQERYAIVTGGSQGLGAVIARHFVVAGASVVLCGRTQSSLDATQTGIEAIAAPDQRVITARCDVANAAEVDDLVALALDAFPHLDILVNNAGVHGPMGAVEDVGWQAWIDAIHINLMGTVYTCRAVLPYFKRRSTGKIINLSGGGATGPLPNFSAYAASKAAVVRFTETLAEEVRDFGIDVNAVAPGALNTRLLSEVIEAGPDKVGADFHARMLKIRSEGGTLLDKGASLCVYLASSASNRITGKLISALWDPWPTLRDHVEDLDGSDIYTLRRIVPEDRGVAWDSG